MSKGNSNKVRKVVPTKPLKIGALIFAAIENLRETKGSTSGKIIDYITLASELPLGRIKPQVKAALEKGVEHGVLKRFRGHYFLRTGDNLARADRIATRFAKLRMPIPSGTIYKTANPNPVSEVKKVKEEKKKGRKISGVLSPVNVPRNLLSNIVKRKNVRKVRSVPLSLTSTVTGKSYYRDEQSSAESDVD